MRNPIRDYRNRRGLTLQRLADELGIHVQAVFLNEQGVYPEILPVIAQALPLSLEEQHQQYTEFQRLKRTGLRALYDTANIELPAPVPKHPVVQFRESLGLSRMAFCKAFCVHPAEMYNIEHGTKHNFSEQLKLALRQAGVSDTVIGELEFRCGEFASGEWVSGADVRSG